MCVTIKNSTYTTNPGLHEHKINKFGTHTNHRKIKLAANYVHRDLQIF